MALFLICRELIIIKIKPYQFVRSVALFPIKYFLVLCAFCCFTQVQAQKYTGTGDSIPELANYLVLQITVNDLPNHHLNGHFGLQSVGINIAHPYIENLEAFLLAPDGTKVRLFTNAGGNGKNFTETIITDTAALSIQENKLAPYSGSFKPQDKLGNVNNYQLANGNWLLYIKDVAEHDRGKVINWSLQFGTNTSKTDSIQSSLPLVLINTYNQTILNDQKIQANLRVIPTSGGLANLADSISEFNGKIEIAKRGWFSASLPQESYNIGLLTQLLKDTSVALLGMPEENDWQLNALYNDKSLIRNPLMYGLFQQMGHYAARTQHCEVYLDGQYMGLYLLTEKIRRTKNRLDIAKLNPQDTTGDELTGGYIFRHDYILPDGWLSNVGPPECPEVKAHFEFEYPSVANINTPQKNYLINWVDTFQTKILGPDFRDPIKGYRPYIDVRSFVDYFICNELAWNGDGFAKSFYFYKDKDSKDSTLHAGPIWDFDWSLKRMPWVNTDLSGWSHTTYPCNNLQATLPWHYIMMQDTFFQNTLRCRWDSLRSTILSTQHIYHYIDSMHNMLNMVQQKHYIRWPTWGFNVGSTELPPFAQNYQEEIDTLKATLGRRLIWLDKKIPGVCKPPSQPPVVDSLVAELQVYPNPASKLVKIQSKDKEILGYSLSNLNGFILKSANFESGQVEISINLSEFNQGMYFLKMMFENSFEVRKLIIIH